MKQSTIRVGFIGLGLMGGAIAERLAVQGFPSTVHDVSKSQMSAMEHFGAAAASSLQNVAEEADVICICVPNGQIMRQIVTDPDFVHALRPGTAVLDFSTVSPSDSRFAAEYLSSRDVTFTDVPIGRTPDHARRGELLIMAGAKEPSNDAAGEVLRALSTEIFYCGGPGLGTAMKLVNNLCNQTILFVTLEAINMAISSGLEQDLAYEVLTRTNANNGHLQTTVPARAFADSYDGGFKLNLARKDIALAIEAANSVGVAVPISASSLQAATLAINSGKGNLDSSAYYQWLTSSNAPHRNV